MLHKMNLAPSAFGAISAGSKTVEMRLNDEKRQNVKVGDKIEFTNTETKQSVKCLVTKLARYNNFVELYAAFDKRVLGYADDEVAKSEDMYEYYAPSLIEKYGVLAIEIKLI